MFSHSSLLVNYTDVFIESLTFSKFMMNEDKLFIHLLKGAKLFTLLFC